MTGGWKSWLSLAWVPLLVAVVPGSSQQQTGCPSPTDTLHFELVTGKVFTSPEDMLDSRPGTLMLTDCIDLCRSDCHPRLVFRPNLTPSPRSNSSCQAANFETGLCVLFSTSALRYPGMYSPLLRHTFSLDFILGFSQGFTW
jgi:hypothetical protein